jgi:MFS family permease
MEHEQMATAGDKLKSALFRARPGGGWIFRSPNPWVFGDTPHYLVDDTQKAQIEAILRPRRPAVVGALLIGGLLAWTVAVATFMWAFAGHEDPTPGDIGLMILLIVIPVIGLLPVAGLIQRHRLRDVLAGAALTNERISYAEVRQNVRAATPFRQSLNALVASLFAFFAAAFGVLMHLVTKHFVFDAYVALWGFVALAFGFASFTWYREVLRKAATLEGEPGDQRRLIKWVGLGVVLVIGVLTFLYQVGNQSHAWAALAVGKAAGGGTVTVSVVGQTTENVAREAALQACRSAKYGNEAARSACAVVATFHRDCFAFAGAEWAIAADEASARKAAAAKCSGTACRVVSGCAKTARR